eukprot:2506274-Heterocapsa_arctica.AAC.1
MPRGHPRVVSPLRPPTRPGNLPRAPTPARPSSPRMNFDFFYLTIACATLAAVRNRRLAGRHRPDTNSVLRRPLAVSRLQLPSDLTQAAFV